MTKPKEKITTASTAAKWLDEGGKTPAGQAWCAVVEADHAALSAVLAAHGEAATGWTKPLIGHVVRPLSAACRRGDTLAAKMLLDAGADPDARSDGNMIASPLYWAAESDSLGCVRLLFAAGADPNPAHESVARHAVQSVDPVLHPHHDVLEALLQAGTAPAPDALLAALERGSPQWAGQLLDAGADPDARDTRPSGIQPLDAVLSRHAPAGGVADRDSLAMRSLQVLLDAGVDVNAEIGEENLYCRPPLLAAVEIGAAWAVEPLMKAGAEPKPSLELIAEQGVRGRGNRDSTTIEALNRVIREARTANVAAEVFADLTNRRHPKEHENA